MINRRSLIALSAALPLTKTVPRLDVEDFEIPLLDTGKVAILGISPDASTLVGVRDGDVICFLDSTSMELISESSSLPELELIDAKSINWSPDGSRLAFSLNALLYFADSDIWVVDVASGDFLNVTPEGHEKEADSLTRDSDIVVDVYPVWTGDNELVFARHTGIQQEKSKVTIESLNLETAKVETVADLNSANVRFVSSPLELLSDGSLTFTSQPNEQNVLEIIMMQPDGTTSTIGIDGAQRLIQIDANDAYSLATEPDSAKTWLISFDGASEPVRFAEAIGYEDQVFIGEASIASNPETYAGVAPSASTGKFRVFSKTGDIRRDRGFLEDGINGNVFCHLAGNTLLVTSRKSAWIVDLSI